MSVVYVFVYLWNNYGNTWIEIITSFKKNSSLKAKSINFKLVKHKTSLTRKKDRSQAQGCYDNIISNYTTWGLSEE